MERICPTTGEPSFWLVDEIGIGRRGAGFLGTCFFKLKKQAGFATKWSLKWFIQRRVMFA